MTDFRDTMNVNYIFDTESEMEYYRLTVLSDYIDIEKKCIDKILKDYLFPFKSLDTRGVNISVCMRRKTFWEFICRRIEANEYVIDTKKKELHLNSVYSFS